MGKSAAPRKKKTILPGQHPTNFKSNNNGRPNVARLFSLRKLPGLVLIALAAVPKLLDWWGRFDILRQAADALGAGPAMLADVVTSLWFSLVLVASGVGYVVFVGEPTKAVQRHRWWPVVGWSVVAICTAAIAWVAIAGYFNFRVQQEVDVRLETARRVTQAQHDQLVANLRPDALLFPLPLTVLAAQGPESTGYAIQLMSAIRDSGIPIQSADASQLIPLQMTPLDTNVRGVFILVKDPKNPPSQAIALARDLGEAGISAPFWTGRSLQGYQYALTVGLE